MKVLFTFLIALSSIIASAQATVKGVVKDVVTGETIPGATVLYGDGKGTVTDLDGKYSFSVPAGNYMIKVQYVGMLPIEKTITVGGSNITLDFDMETEAMKEVEVIGDIAVGRKTPVAYSDISSIKIKEELGTRDLPLLLNSTPGIYATSQGGGDGDARINIRGFNQRYVAVMVDGIPMNDMENGWVYWSNWFGMDAVTQKVQVQRGLGASKLAIPSVGGTMNIMSQGIDQKRQITFSSEVGNNQNLRETVGYNSGRLKGGWGITSAISVSKNKGWVENLRSKRLFYFLKIQKEWLNHSVSVSIMGSPQEHYQRPIKMPISFYDVDYALKQGVDTSMAVQTDFPYPENGNFGSNHNQHWNTLVRNRKDKNADEEILSERINYYHKPIGSLKHFWTPTEKLAISTILYASFGRGGGTRLKTTIVDQNTGQVDLDSIYYTNTHAPSIFSPVYDLSFVNDTSQYKSRNYIFSQENNHFWTGVLSTVKYKLNKRFELSGGADLRYYHTDRYQVMYDLLGGDYAVPDGDGSDYNNPQIRVVREGDIFGYKLRTYVKQGGLFFLTEYGKNNLTAFINLTASINTYNRTNYFALKTADGQYQTSGWKTFPGGSLKGGASYRLTENHSVFINAGYLSRAQMPGNVYKGSNIEVFPVLENEKIIAQEIGYSYNRKDFKFSFNAYNTNWLNKPVILDVPVGTEVYRSNVPGMNALHQGVEFDADYKISKYISVDAILSIGNWRWTSGGEGAVFDELGQQVSTFKFNAQNVKVGDAAQTQTSVGLRFAPIKGLYIKPRFTYFDNFYSDSPISTISILIFNLRIYKA